VPLVLSSTHRLTARHRTQAGGITSLCDDLVFVLQPAHLRGLPVCRSNPATRARSQQGRRVQGGRVFPSSLHQSTNAPPLAPQHASSPHQSTRKPPTNQSTSCQPLACVRDHSIQVLIGKTDDNSRNNPASQQSRAGCCIASGAYDVLPKQGESASMMLRAGCAACHNPTSSN
jgi:hypothetical protein